MIVTNFELSKVISHVKKRVTSLQSVRLPMTDLFDLISNQPSGPCATFATVFIKLGLSRISDDDVGDILSRCLIQSKNDYSYLTLWSMNLHRIFNENLKKQEDLILVVEKFLCKFSSLVDKNQMNLILVNLYEHFTAILTDGLTPRSCTSGQVLIFCFSHFQNFDLK